VTLTLTLTLCLSHVNSSQGHKRTNSRDKNYNELGEDDDEEDPRNSSAARSDAMSCYAKLHVMSCDVMYGDVM
jgi:hypothetical protein